MKVQVLVAAMGQKDHSLLNKMNIQTDVIVGNQTDFDSVEHFVYKGYKASYLNFNERGVGLNRNNALMRADGDICLFADDDMKYVDGYEEMLVKAFQDIPDADVIVFNLIENPPRRYVIQRVQKLNRLNYLRYGTTRVAVRLDKVRKAGIYFNQCFGGGAMYSHGEDNLFLTACLDKGLKIYAIPEFVATLTEERESSWREGYTDKYFRDQGYLYRAISRRWWRLLCLQDAIRRCGRYGCSAWVAYKKMIYCEEE